MTQIMPKALTMSFIALGTLIVYMNVHKDNPFLLINSCTTPLCKNAVKKLEERMDPTVDPCDDFYQFTCGASANSSSFDYESLTNPQYTLAEMQRRMNARLISSLEKDHHVNDTKPMKVVKNLYKSCVNKSAIEEQSLASFLNIAEQVGGWPVLKEDTWNEAAFDWTKLIFKRGFENHWVISFLPIVPKQDAHNKLVFNIYVGEPDWKVPQIALIKGTENNGVKKYLKYMIDVAVSMGANETYARSEMEDVLDFEIQLAKSTSLGKSLISEYQEYLNMNKEKLNIPVSLSDLERKFPFISWKNYIRSKLPFSVTLKDIENRIIVSNFEYIHHLNNLMNVTEKRVVANYFMWQNFLNFDFTFRKNISDITRNYYSYVPIDIPASTACLTVVATLVPRALANLYVHEHFDNQSIDFNIFFDDIRIRFIELLLHAEWIQNNTKEIILEKMLAMSHTVGFPKRFFEDSLMTDESFQNLQTTDDNYIMNLFNIAEYREKLIWKNLDPIAARESELWKEYDDRLITPDAFYNDRMNSVILLPALLQGQDIICNNDFPIYMNYGKLGYILGHEIGSSFDFTSSKYNKNFEEFKWENMSHDIYMDKLTCFFNQHEDKNSEDRVKFVNEDFIGNTGLRATYNAYKEFSKLDVSQELKGKNYTSEQLFWISVANSYCETPNAAHLDDISSSSRIYGTFSNIEEFSNDFNCPKGSRMNRLDKCRV